MCITWSSCRLLYVYYCDHTYRPYLRLQTVPASFSPRVLSTGIVHVGTYNWCLHHLLAVQRCSNHNNKNNRTDILAREWRYKLFEDSKLFVVRFAVCCTCICSDHQTNSIKSKAAILTNTWVCMNMRWISPYNNRSYAHPKSCALREFAKRTYHWRVFMARKVSRRFSLSLCLTNTCIAGANKSPDEVKPERYSSTVR